MTPRPNAFPQRLVRAAGAVVWRPVGSAIDLPAGSPLTPDDFEVLLVHRPRYRDWAWPKGKAELNEPIAQAAVREVEEEAGVAVALRAPLTTQRYRLGSGHTKEVRYWVGQLLRSEPSLSAREPVMPASKKEIDQVQWARPAKAKQILTRRGDRRLLNEIVARAARGDLETSTITLLRHAKAVGRSSWDGSDASRPLSRLGGTQALDLVPSLSAFGVNEIISSPWTRCLQTVGPYAAVAGITIQQVEALTEDAVASDPRASRRLILDLLELRTGSRLVSLHRPGLSPLIKPIYEYSGVSRVMNGDTPQLATSEMYVAHVSHANEPHVLDIEKHRTYTKLTHPS